MADQTTPTERKDVVIEAPVLVGRITTGYEFPPKPDQKGT